MPPLKWQSRTPSIVRIFPIESPRLIRLVHVCCFVGEDFVVPHQKKIGGELLDLNYANIYQQNKAELLKFLKVFGLAFLGDGATIH